MSRKFFGLHMNGILSPGLISGFFFFFFDSHINGRT